MDSKRSPEYFKKYKKERSVNAYPKHKYIKYIVAEAANDAVSKSYIVGKIIERYYDSLPTATIDKLKVVYNNLDENEK